MPTRRVPEPVTENRPLLVARLASQLDAYTSPRTHLWIIMVLAGCGAFLTSVVLLWSPADVFELMAPRYAAAAVGGYLVFLLLIRAWIALHRPPAGGDSVLDVVDLADAFIPGPSGPPSPDRIVSPFAGGRSGGGGASQAWSSAPSRSAPASDNWWPFAVDEDFFWLVLAAVCALGGAFAIFYVIYMAPILLAEIALDAAIISALYRRLRHDEQGYWLTTAVRRTWVPAVLLVVFAFLAGYALQQAAPQARTIGAVMQSLWGQTQHRPVPDPGLTLTRPVPDPDVTQA